MAGIVRSVDFPRTVRNAAFAVGYAKRVAC